MPFSKSNMTTHLLPTHHSHIHHCTSHHPHHYLPHRPHTPTAPSHTQHPPTLQKATPSSTPNLGYHSPTTLPQIPGTPHHTSQMPLTPHTQNLHTEAPTTSLPNTSTSPPLPLKTTQLQITAGSCTTRTLPQPTSMSLLPSPTDRTGKPHATPTPSNTPEPTGSKTTSSNHTPLTDPPMTSKYQPSIDYIWDAGTPQDSWNQARCTPLLTS